jgi:hypothetical protein
MKRDSSVVVNSGNLLHCLRFDLEKNGLKSSSASNSKSTTATTSTTVEDSLILLAKWPQPSTSSNIFRYVSKTLKKSLQKTLAKALVKTLQALNFYFYF